MDATFEHLNRELDSAFSEMQPNDWLRAPEGKWNTAQIAEHLSRAYSGTAKMLELALISNEYPAITSATLKQRFGHMVIIRCGYFPSGANAPEPVRPKGLDGIEALRRIRENIMRMDLALTEAEKRWGTGALANHPLLGPLTAKEWRKFHVLHGLHHLRQVRKLRKSRL